MKKFWRFIKNEAQQTAELLLYGVISETTWQGDEVTPKQFARDLADLGDVKQIKVRINSPGGDVFAGHAIYNLLRSHAASIVVMIDGIAASVASVIAMAGDEVVMPGNSMMMVHNPWGAVMGNAEELRNVADGLDKIRETIITVYQDKTKLGREKIIELLNAETWLTAEEAKGYGFADRLIEPVKVAASIRSGFYNINGQDLDLSGLRVWPGALLASCEAPAAPPSVSNSNPAPPASGHDESEVKNMKARALLDKLRNFFSIDKFPVLNRALDSLRQETAEDAPAETVIDRVGAMISTAISDAVSFIDSIKGLGIDSVEKAKELVNKANLGEQYRASLVKETLEQGVRAQGEAFNKELWNKMLSEPTRSIDDITSFRDQFRAEADNKLGPAGRQTPAGDPNAQPQGSDDREFEKLPKAEQDKRIKAFMERTGGVPKS